MSSDNKPFHRRYNHVPQMNFCNQCAQPLVRQIPDGDSVERFMCNHCHSIHYQNPKVIAGCIIEYQKNILLCKRAIEPRYGLWTLPAGFLENGESCRQGALRESYEEACTRPQNLKLFAIYNITRISQIYILYRGELSEPDFSPGTESLETRLYAEEDIPWDIMAFDVAKMALKKYFMMRRDNSFYPFEEDI